MEFVGLALGDIGGALTARVGDPVFANAGT
jgi:hypothetical protein